MQSTTYIPKYVAALILLILVLSNVWYIREFTYQEKTASDALKIANRDVLYAHIHMAKTAGSTLNGKMAMRYKSVCGNKGYSLFAFQDNERRRNMTQPIPLNKIPKDSITKISRNHWYHKIGIDIMNEIGYEDCEWLSAERPWDFWVNTFQNWHVPVELHLPCRDPVDHLMSQNNYRKQGKFKFNCTAENITHEIKDNFIFQNRFSMELLEVDNFHVKCFDTDKLSSYIDLMGKYLLERKIQREYVRWETNNPRDKDSECIWKDPHLMKTVEDYMINRFDYYKFCNQCIGSEDDLLLE